MNNSTIETLDYLKSLGCIIENEIMERTIEKFGYKSTQEVIAIDGHVMSMVAFEEFAADWCKIIKPRL